MTGFCYPELMKSKAFSKSEKKQEGFVRLFYEGKIENTPTFPGFLSLVISLNRDP